MNTAFKLSAIKSETLRNLIEILDADACARYHTALSCKDHREYCCVIGAMAAVLDILADKMGGLWMFGARFADDAEQLRAFCAHTIANAQELAKLAEVVDVDIVEIAADRVYYWIEKSAQDDARNASADTTETETPTEATETTETETNRRKGLRGSALSLFAALSLAVGSMFCSCSEPANAQRVAADDLEIVHWFCCRGGLNSVGVVGGDTVAFHLEVSDTAWDGNKYGYIAGDSLTVYPCQTNRNKWGNTDIILL